MKRYIKHILPAAAMLLSVGLSSCIGDLDVTPIDPNKRTELDPVALFNQCYANLAIEGLDGPGSSTVSAERQDFYANCSILTSLPPTKPFADGATLAWQR